MPRFKDILEGLKALPKSIFDFINKYFPLILGALIPLSVAVIIGMAGMYILIWAGIDFNPAKIFFKVCATLSQVYMLAFCAFNDSESDSKTFDGYFPVSIIILYFCWSI